MTQTEGSPTCRSTLGNRSLSSDSYIPDFTAVALNSAPFRMLRIRRSAFRAALEATQLSGVVGYQVRSLCLQSEHDVCTAWRPDHVRLGMDVCVSMQRARTIGQAAKGMSAFDGVQGPQAAGISSRGVAAQAGNARSSPGASMNTPHNSVSSTGMEVHSRQHDLDTRTYRMASPAEGTGIAEVDCDQQPLLRPSGG